MLVLISRTIKTQIKIKFTACKPFETSFKWNFNFIHCINQQISKIIFNV